MRRFALATTLAFIVVGCGSDGSPSVSTDTASVSTSSPTTVGSSSTTTDAAATDTTEVVVDDEVTRISVTVGVDSAADRVEEVTLGQRIELTIVNPGSADEFHLHGYDLGGEETPAGQPKVFEFTATEIGDFEVESHVTNGVLVVIRVS